MDSSVRTLTAHQSSFECHQSRCLRVGIIGAGSSGLYLAILLKKQGHEVTLFEQAPQPKAEGCGIMLVAAGMQALFAGCPHICEDIVKAGMPVKTFEFRNLKDQIVDFQATSYQENNELTGILVHRTKILNTLLDHLPPDSLQTQAKLKSLEQTDTQVIAYFEDDRTWTGDIVVGADGIFSTVRDEVLTGSKPNYLGDIVWRGVVHDDRFCVEGNFMVYIRSRGVYANFFDLGQGFTHWGFFIEKEQASTELGQGRPQDVTLPISELAKLPEPARTIIESTPIADIKCRFSYDLDTLPCLHQGRTVLIGDAAHAKSPTRAQGMTSGLEDALVLSRHLSVSRPIAESLVAFEAERLPIVHEYQRSSRAISMKTRRKKCHVA